MKAIRAIAAALALAAVGAPAQAAPKRRAAAPKKRFVVAALGDSLTDPRAQGGKYLDVLRKRCPESRFDNYGVGGHMVNQMRRRLLRDVFGEGSKPGDAPKPRYSHLIVLGGINDICSDETAKRTNPKIERDLRWIYQTAHDRGVQVVALTLPPWGGFRRYFNRRRGRSTRKLNAWIRAQTRRPEVWRVVDVFPLLSCGDPDKLCQKHALRDQVHWSAAAHRVVGRKLHASVFASCR